MLITAKLDNNLWGEAVTAANYLRNSLPCAALDGKSRYEEIYNKETKISHRKVFGCVANPLKLNNKDDKFASISKKNCILIGYGEKERIYWILNKKAERTEFEISRNKNQKSLIKNERILNEDLKREN